MAISRFPNDANASPVAASDAYAVDEDRVLTVAAATGVLANDTDADGDTLTAQLVSLPAHGAVTLSADGSFVYTPNANFNGADAFTYLANDGGLPSGTATVTLTIGSVADTPAAATDSYSVDEDDTLSVDAAAGLLANDTDADGDALTAQLVSLPTHGAVTLSADGSFVYTPNANFNGTDAFTYLANDGGLTSGTATVTLTIGSVADTPVAVADSYSVEEDDTLSVAAVAGVLANDTDADGDALTAQLVSLPTHGAVTLSADGSFVYTPNANFNGTDAFTYLANDGGLTSGAATVTLTIGSVADTPAAMADSYSVDEDDTLSVAAVAGILANDTDADGDALTAQLVSLPTHGAVTLSADGSFVYTPNANFNGTDAFTYLANDGGLTSDTATVTVIVNHVNSPAQAMDDAYTVNEDSILAVDAVFGLLANDTDLDGDVLSAVLFDPPDHGQLSLNDDGSLTYTPDADFNGIDTFSYQADDGVVASNTAIVTVDVVAVDDTLAVALPAEFSNAANVAARTVGETIDFTVAVADPDSASHVFQLDLEASGIPGGEVLPTIDSSSGRFCGHLPPPDDSRFAWSSSIRTEKPIKRRF